MLVVLAIWISAVIFGFTSSDSWRNTFVTYSLLIAGISVFGLGVFIGVL